MHLDFQLGNMPGAHGCERKLHGDRVERSHLIESQTLVSHGLADYIVELIVAYCKMNFRS